MDQVPVNSIENNSNTIRVNDTNTPIKLKFKYVDGSIINLKDKIDYFYLTKDDDKFYSVTDITFEGDELIFKLPNLIKGLYRVEIRDIEGSIYPADDSLFILLKRSFEEGKESYYTSYREDILNNVEPIIIQHIDKNPDKFRGERGQQGFPGRDGLPGIDGKDGKDGIDGEKGEPGKDGSMSFVDLTPEEKEELRGERGRPGLDGKDGIDGIDGKDGLPGRDGIDGKDGIIENVNPNLIPLDINMWELGGKYSSGGNWDNGISIRMIEPFKIEEGIEYTFSDKSNLDLRVRAIKAFIYKDGQMVQYVVRAYNQSINFLSEGDECIIVVDGRSDRPLQLNDITNVDFKVKLEKGLIETPLIDAIHQNHINIDNIDKLKNDTFSIENYKNQNNTYTDALNTALLESDYVYIPPGEYDMETNIQVPSNKTIEGAGNDTILNFSGTANPSFRMIGDIEEVRNITYNVTNFTDEIRLDNVTGLNVNDYVRIRSQRNALSRADSEEWFLGSKTGSGTAKVGYGEYKKIVKIEGDTITLDSSLVYPFYYSHDNGEVDPVLPNAVVQKVNFIENVTIKNIRMNRPMYNTAITVRYCRNVIIDNVYLNNVGYTGNLLSGHTNIDRSLDCHVINSKYYLNQGITPPALNELTIYKIVSSQNCGFDNCISYNAGQTIDITHLSGSIPSTNCYITNCKIYNSQSTGITTHGGCFTTLIKDNLISGDSQGINNRGKKSIIKDNIIKGRINTTDTELAYGIGMYQGGTGHSIITGNTITNFKNGIKFIDGGTFPERHMKNLSVIVSDNIIDNCVYGIEIFRYSGADEELGILITNNNFILGFASGYLFTSGIFLNENVKGIKIISNVFKGRGGLSSYSERGVSLDVLTVSNNIIALNSFSNLRSSVFGDTLAERNNYFMNTEYNIDNPRSDIF